MLVYICTFLRILLTNCCCDFGVKTIFSSVYTIDTYICMKINTSAELTLVFNFRKTIKMTGHYLL